jgi:hypothetical protein
MKTIEVKEQQKEILVKVVNIGKKLDDLLITLNKNLKTKALAKSK